MRTPKNGKKGLIGCGLKKKGVIGCKISVKGGLMTGSRYPPTYGSVPLFCWPLLQFDIFLSIWITYLKPLVSPRPSKPSNWLSIPTQYSQFVCFFPFLFLFFYPLFYFILFYFILFYFFNFSPFMFCFVLFFLDFCLIFNNFTFSIFPIVSYFANKYRVVEKKSVKTSVLQPSVTIYILLCQFSIYLSKAPHIIRKKIIFCL